MKTKAKIATVDIETSPIVSYTWGLFDQNVGLEQVKSDWYILSFSYKMLGEDKVHFHSLKGRMDYNPVTGDVDDTYLLEKLHALIDEVDIIIAHNGIKFDMKKIKARLIMKGFTPPSPVKVIDTMRMAKQQFGFTSNKLAYLSDKLTVTRKRDHAKFAGFKLWLGCLADCDEAWEEMQLYNDDDVRSCEELFIVLAPWVEGLPNLNLYDDSEVVRCPSCGSDNVHKRGFYYAMTGHYQRYRCMDCTSWSRGKVLLNTKEKRKSLLVK